MAFKKKTSKDKESKKKNKKEKIGSGSLKIVDETGLHGNENAPKIIAIIGFICVIIALIIFAVVHFTKKPDDYPQFEAKKEMYSDYGIEYTYEDYKKDLQAVEKAKDEFDKNNDSSSKSDSNKNSNNSSGTNTNTDGLGKNIADNSALPSDNVLNPDSYIVSDDDNGISDATKEVINKNEEVINDMNELTGFKVDQKTLCQSIIDQTKRFNKFIDGHLGIYDDKYDDMYHLVKEYNDNLVKTFTEGGEANNDFGLSTETVQGNIRYCIFTNELYSGDREYPNYKKILKNYMKIGHPIIESVDFVTFEQVAYNENNEYDGHNPNLKANIVSGDKTYTVYLTSSGTPDGGDYIVLDIENRKSASDDNK